MTQPPPRLFRAIGFMSGTSLDGLDAAILETDGRDHVRPLAFLGAAYDAPWRARLRNILGPPHPENADEIRACEEILTRRHSDHVHELLRHAGMTPRDVDVVGVHGQTLWHRPQERVTIQIGDGALLARLLGLPVVHQFRLNDVQTGGQGAPLVPVYHRALTAACPKPLAVLNIGGVANVTWIGSPDEADLVAFDVGPGNALLDDWLLRTTGRAYDEGGALAATGRPDEAWLAAFLAHPFFAAPPPKSLDRAAFHALPLPPGTSPADGAATLTHATARAITRGLQHLPALPRRLYVTGGGRLNTTLLFLLHNLVAPATVVGTIESLGANGDALEAEAFAYLAVRSILGLPLSFPGTTGVPTPMTGGIVVR